MTRTAMIGATFALLMTSGAFAQMEPPPAPGDLAPPPPELSAEPAPDAGAPDLQIAPEAGEPGEMAPARMRDRGNRAERREERRERRAERRREGRGERFDWRRHHGGPMMGERMQRGRMGPQGAVFRFNRGDGGPSVMIKCADRDTTQECVDAVLPMLQNLLPDQP